MKLIGKQVLTPSGWQRDLLIEVTAGRIVAVGQADSAADADYYPFKIVPGFIDIQVNGGGGVLLNQQCSVDAISTMMQAHRRFGTTAMLPTLITDSVEVMARTAASIVKAREQGVAGIVGVHFEGPWLSTVRKGVHSEQFIRPPTDRELAIISDPALGKVMVTLAPETVPVSVIQTLSQAGVLVFLGHSNANAAEVEQALDAGAVGFTHLFNAMSPMQSREPGMVGVALASAHSYCGLILDGFHVAPQTCQVAMRAKGPERMILVTDAMAPAGTELNDVEFFDTRILRHGNKLTTPDGTLAGSCLTMIEAVRNAVSWCRVDLADAVAMASTTPATLLGLQDTMGQIAVGSAASFLCLDENLSIRHLWQQGTKIELNDQEPVE
ncbi:N-acetylglucosamine-6-phosphate deacetylase [Alteromonas aestuariivivens]|uniref:N-acetylgalactosamine-6-phosphate deacetylase n=1 Tax=Alteromonas aestuariivivens TaxID=1938339 RepID=A0A3D8MAB3_9ALTE|nr:N-acetylglucosamine-6-phosphate deacetylase [Alteromonas aestuariivivens]RDV26628.1 N-acetylglucosamine-6-phosphate deacetylase [Alteromonas aestuariivivens]